jgi:hypothetical protein
MKALLIFTFACTFTMQVVLMSCNTPRNEKRSENDLSHFTDADQVNFSRMKGKTVQDVQFIYNGGYGGHLIKFTFTDRSTMTVYNYKYLPKIKM